MTVAGDSAASQLSLGKNWSSLAMELSTGMASTRTAARLAPSIAVSPKLRRGRGAELGTDFASPLRTTSVFFQGSIGVAPLRARLLRLRNLPGASIVDVPRSVPNTTLTKREGRVGGTATSAKERGAELISRENGASGHENGANQPCDHSMPCATKLEFARRMLCSEYCVIPKGDTPTSSRFYSAIACGCVPLVVSDDIQPHLPYARQVCIEPSCMSVRTSLLSTSRHKNDRVSRLLCRTPITLLMSALRPTHRSITRASCIRSRRAPSFATPKARSAVSRADCSRSFRRFVS